MIKADGLAAGKGVVLPETTEEAMQVLDDFLNKGLFGSAGRSIVIEEFLEGREVSLTTLSDGTTIKSFHVGQDHKRIGDQDRGPNTGGMGVFAPVPFVTDAMKEQIDDLILKPTLKALQQEGMLMKFFPLLDSSCLNEILQDVHSMDYCLQESCSRKLDLKYWNTMLDLEIQKHNRSCLC